MRSVPLMFGLALLASHASAEPISSNRPGQSSPPTVVGPGVFQIEGGLLFERETNGSPNTNTITVPQVQLRVGLLSFLEAQLYADGYIFENRSGASDRSSGSDMAIGARARLFDQRGLLPATALDFDLSFPTGSDAVTSDGFDPTGSFLFEWYLTESISLHSNVLLASVSQGKGTSKRTFEVTPTVSLGAPLGKRTSVFVEYYATFIDSGFKDEHAVDGGFAWLVGENLQLDLFAGAGLSDAAPDFFVSAGASWRFSL